MKDKKKVAIKCLLTESLRLRQLSTEKYFELFIEMKSIFDKKDLLKEKIKTFNQKDEQLYLTAINAKIAKNKAFIKKSAGKISTSDIDRESALFFMDNLNKSAEERLRLTEDDRLRLQVIMAKLEPIITDRDAKKAFTLPDTKNCFFGFPGLPDTEGCLTCTNSCLGTCSSLCIGKVYF
jgi:hypothetical protein